MRYFTVISILVFSLCFFRVTNAQTNISVTVKDSLTEYPFICVKENILSDSLNTMALFYEKLKILKSDTDTVRKVVNILHLGDSHIQAGFLSGQMMSRFQSDFGNAGRGLIVPLKLIKSNEPRDYAIRSTASWFGSRCVDRKNYPCPGLGGMAVATRDTSFFFDIATLSKTDSCNAFCSVTVFHHPRTSPLSVISQKKGVNYYPTRWPFASRIELDTLVCNLHLKGQSMFGDTSIYYAMSLENRNSGILYHSSGINGSCYSHYVEAGQVLNQTAALTPDLIILSLGTNEAFGKCDQKDIYDQIDRVVSMLRDIHPGAVFLLTTPPECHRRVRRKGKKKYYYTYVTNTKVEKVAETIRRYAVDKGLACWDLFSISGGRGSAKSWVKYQLSARDRIHFNIKGYELQGNLLYDAIIKGYNDYVGK